MKYGYTIIYVSSVEETLEFYKKAFVANRVDQSTYLILLYKGLAKGRFQA